MKNFKASAFYRLGASSETGTSFILQFHNLNFYTRNFRITNIKVIYNISQQCCRTHFKFVCGKVFKMSLKR